MAMNLLILFILLGVCLDGFIGYVGIFSEYQTDFWIITVYYLLSSIVAMAMFLIPKSLINEQTEEQIVKF